jgi:hypothetical protein
MDVRIHRVFFRRVPRMIQHKMESNLPPGGLFQKFSALLMHFSQAKIDFLAAMSIAATLGLDTHDKSTVKEMPDWSRHAAS